MKPITIVGLINDPKKTVLTTKVNTKLSGRMADKTLASSNLNAENKNASARAQKAIDSTNKSSM